MKNYYVVVIDRSSSKTLFECNMPFASKTELNKWAKKEIARQATNGHDVNMYAYETGVIK